jgi:hypothetical protein
VLSDYNLPGQHLHQGVPPGLRICDNYTRGSDVVLSDYNLSRQHLQGVAHGLLLCESYTGECPHQYTTLRFLRKRNGEHKCYLKSKPYLGAIIQIRDFSDWFSAQHETNTF